MPSPRAGTCDITNCLLAWQATADEARLEEVIAATLPRLEHAARGTLRRLHISDWSAVDDAVSLVFDHVRRLPLASAGDRAVARFDTRRAADERAGDQGLAYLVWLAHERARDVARQRRRQAKRRQLLTAAHRAILADSIDGDARGDVAESECDTSARLQAALAMLEPRLRAVVDLLLDGKSQAVIAHVLGVCEGTVSRLRSRAIAELKQLMVDSQ